MKKTNFGKWFYSQIYVKYKVNYFLSCKFTISPVEGEMHLIDYTVSTTFAMGL